MHFHHLFINVTATTATTTNSTLYFIGKHYVHLFPPLQVSLSMIHENEERSTYRTTTTPERQEIAQMVKCRMANLNLPVKDYGKYLDNLIQFSFY